MTRRSRHCAERRRRAGARLTSTAARLAGRFEAFLDEHPGEAGREQYTRADRAAVEAYRAAVAAVDALAEAQR